MAEEPIIAIAAEASRIEEAAMYSAQSQFSSSKFWRGLHLAIGVPTALGAGITGASALADIAGKRAVGVTVLIVAGLTTLMTVLNAAQRAEQSRVSANAYLALQGDARVLRTADMPQLSVDEAREQLGKLVERRSALNAEAPVPTLLAYRLGSRNIKRGRQHYTIDRLSLKE